MLARRPSIAHRWRRFLALAVTATVISTASSSIVFAQHAGENLPPLMIIAPKNGATVIGPVIIVFETPANLSEMTMGSHARSTAHLHIDLDKRMTMPSIKQLTQVGPNRYQFNLGRAKPGKHSIRLYWGDNRHKPLGSTRVVSITVK